MPLKYERPSDELANELAEVRADASELIVYIQKINIPFPDEFPAAKLVELANLLIELPDGTARGCREPLLFAQEKLAAIRGTYIGRDEDQPKGFGSEAAPRPQRRDALDIRLTSLMSSVSTALQVANREHNLELEIEGSPEPTVEPPDKAPIERINVIVQESEAKLGTNRDQLDGMSVPGSLNADRLRRRLTDAIALNRLASAELRAPRIVPAWLKRIGNALREYPKVILTAASAIKLTADIADWAHDKWSRYTDEVFKLGTKLIRDVANDISQYAQSLDEYRRAQIAAARAKSLTAPTPYIAWPNLREIIIQGREIPLEWRPLIKQIDLSHETELVDISNLSVLVNLEELLLSRTNVFDIGPIAQMKRLRRLELSRTKVTDIGPLTAATELRKLDIDGLTITNINALSDLKNLEELDLSRTSVSDLRPLKNLSKLRILDASHTLIDNLVPISDLDKLEKLDISHTRVTNLFSFGGLSNLSELYLEGTNIPEIEVTTVVRFMRKLQNFSAP